jgi:plastocyanin
VLSPRRTPALAALATVVLPLPLHLGGGKTTPRGDQWRGKVLLAHKPPARKHHRRHIRVALPAPRPRAHAAGDPTDTIADFMFSPATTTVHVGDTVAWVNNGPSAHTATANDGSFNTGILQKDQSASHTFTQAGTFAYICSIHPFMHGTIVVVAAATSATTPSSSSGSGSGSSSSGSSGSGSSGATSSGATSSSASSGASLPMTGIDVGATLLSGVGLLGAGVALRRRVARR